MNVYLLYINYWDGVDQIAAVYSTLEKAEEARKTISKRFRSRIEKEKVL
jgi:hypothetical protein